MEPVIERYDIDTLFRVLFDIRRALQSIERLLEEDDGGEEAEEAPDEP